MNIDEILDEKKANQPLNKEELDFFIYSLSSGKLSEAKAVEFMQIINTKNFSFKETYLLADSMARSGKVLDIAKKVGECVDKHSAGLVSDASTLIFMSVLAALNVKAVKGISEDYGDYRNSMQRLKAFEGFSASISEEKLVKNLEQYNIGVFNETNLVAPADVTLYKLRKKFRILSEPLIAASILSKKIAMGASTVVYDVKTGDGAISNEPQFAENLAKYLVEASKLAGIKAAAVISDLNQPLSSAFGKYIEIKEVIRELETKEPAHDEGLMDVARELVIMALILTNKATGRSEASNMFDQVISNGAALAKFKEFVGLYGGKYDQLAKQTFTILDSVAVSYITAKESGYIDDIVLSKTINAYYTLAANTKRLGPDDKAGVVLLKREGSKVNAGDKIYRIYYSLNNKVYPVARQMLEDSIILQKNKPVSKKTLYKVII